MNITTYPARPINGGPFPKAREKIGQWVYEPKFNGWRALVHIETGTMFNRKGDHLSINGEFKTALAQLKGTLDAEAFKWADVEALERRHGIGQGCLIVLDVIPEPAARAGTYQQRRQWFETVLPELDLMPNSLGPWTKNSFPPLSIPPQVYGTLDVWQDLQLINKRLGCQFYEGLVAKKVDSIYPIQLRSPEEDFPFWVKHRTRF
jgi:ATP-dependent DNA ligase